MSEKNKNSRFICQRLWRVRRYNNIINNVNLDGIVRPTDDGISLVLGNTFTYAMHAQAFWVDEKFSRPRKTREQYLNLKLCNQEKQFETEMLFSSRNKVDRVKSTRWPFLSLCKNENFQF